MKVKDLLTMDIDVDVYDNVCEELAIAFCAPVELTDAGKAHFEIALNLDIESLDDGVCIVDVEDEFFPDNWEFKLQKAAEFFYSAAGFCPIKTYQKWFKD